MSYCLDTNILLRWIEPGTPMCEQARSAVQALRALGEDIYILPQNIVEFWNGATRPTNVNGLGLTPAQADAEIGKIEALFPLLADTPAVHTEWRKLVTNCSVSGVQVHDARIAASMLTHGVTNLLTFNARHFSRFGIVAISPPDLLQIP
jgi:predicted nucleic acid-binding protein